MSYNKELVNTDSLSVALLNKIQSIPESELRENIITPLFYSMGFEKVDNYHGQYESGKDLICWRLDDIGSPECAVVQIKKYKPSVSASDKNNFSEVVNQLIQASEKKVPHTDGLLYFPSLIFFITPFPVDTRALETRFEAYQELRKNRVKIIDGHALVKLVKSKLPQPVIESLIGREMFLCNTLISDLSNIDLLNALEARFPKDISSFYCDLDLCLGRINTRLLSSLSFKPIVRMHKLRADADSGENCHLIRK